MKKFVTASLFVFIAITAGVAVVGLVSRDKNNQPIVGSNTDTVGLVLSKVELAKHNSSKSCWLLISGKIYDVTSFLPSHPGEAKTILPACGTDATGAFGTKGKPDGKPHSSSANAMLADYYIGNLNQTVNATPTPSVNSSQAEPIFPQSRYDDDEFDD